MKGMLGLLEKAGLVRMDPTDHAVDATAPAADVAPDFSHRTREETTAGVMSSPQPKLPLAAPIALEDIYSKAGVPASNYPAERLLRLIEGLSAMDEPVRLMAIKAMDAADESWTIEDPINDAQAKLKALGLHGELLDLNLQALERDTQKATEAIKARQEKVSTDIRQQMAELEALMAREVAKAAQEVARKEAQLSNARDHTTTELASLAHLTTQLHSLIARFGPLPATSSTAHVADAKE